MDYQSAIDQFFSEEKKGECGNDEFESDNLYRKIIKCKFCVNEECHYTGECKNRNNLDYFDGVGLGMNIKELEELVETSFELKPGPLYIIGLKGIEEVEIFQVKAKYLLEQLKKEGIKSIIVPASDIDKIYKLEKSDVK